ncbi:hypothetical protein COOONC_08256 [Cooperia oncophora]
MDSEKYCQILERCYIPFNNNIYHGQCSCSQKRVHKCTSRNVKVRLLDWPPESPDLNPIELVWGNMKDFIREQPWLSGKRSLQQCVLNMYKE